MKQEYYQKGYNECMSGYYDKWYRYNTFDDGASYDAGCMAATLNEKCEDNCIIIECSNGRN